MAMALSDIMNCIGLLSTHEMTVMSGTLATMRLKMFLNANGCSPEAKAFGISAKDAIVRGGKVDFILKIAESLKEGSKEECVHDKMRSTSGNYIAGILGNFKGDYSEFSINIESATSLPNGVRGTTRYIGDKTIQIKINSSLASSDSALEVARTIFHEYMHADMKRKIYTKLALTIPSDMTFIETYNSFESNGFEPTPEHETMAKLYVNAMASGLASFHKNELRADFDRYTDYFGEEPSANFYKALAWQGLSNQGVQAWADLTESERELFTNLQARTGALTKACEK